MLKEIPSKPQPRQDVSKTRTILDLVCLPSREDVIYQFNIASKIDGITDVSSPKWSSIVDNMPYRTEYVDGVMVEGAIEQIDELSNPISGLWNLGVRIKGVDKKVE